MMAKKQPRPLVTWEPVTGNGIYSFISGIDFLANDVSRQEVVVQQAKRILSRCANPTLLVDRKCSLVLGQVQSGKTLSFTSVIALARDNGISLTVLLGGTKRPLMQQTYERLTKDLTADSLGSSSKWLIKKDSKVTDKVEIMKALATQSDSYVPDEYKQSVVIVVMKNRAGIKKVENLLNSIQKDLGRNLPVLIIDDEGDQASPNTKHEKDEQSATYSSIWDLRDALPNHSFLSYTATPEANLLLELDDILSPDSVVVLTPGDEYIGGYDLFVDRSSNFVNVISEDELEVATAPSDKDLPPKSLVDSLAYFLVAMAVAHKAYPAVRPISMLIHPDSKIDSHTKYRKWVKSILDRWIIHFEENDDIYSNSYKIPLDFSRAIQELERTISLSEIFPGAQDPIRELLRLVRYWLNSESIEVRVVNSERPNHNVSPDEWKNKAGWILIGAGKLDRGFVVEKLAVTYMPRGRGGGNVDTIQQRGRFFGYKKTYLPLLRGWVSQDLNLAYKDIVETESEMRIELEDFDRNSYQLQDWGRNMILAQGLSPTRKNIISMNYSMLDLKDNSWFQQKRLFDPVLRSMQADIEEKIVELMKDSEITSLDNRMSSTRHKKALISIPELLELLVDWPRTGEDKITFSKHLVLLSKYARSHKDTNATIFFMNQLEVGIRSAEKGSTGERKYWSINNLHEGRNESSKSAYIGDKGIKSEDSISLQIHRIAPRDDRGSTPDSPVYAVALAWPNGFRKRVLEQL
jgi:Z1 domain